MAPSDDRTGGQGDATRALVAAVTVAARAPSIHNTQPWHWRIRGRVADLWADTRRQLHIADPDRRLLVLSCGAALHHARVALTAAGVGFEVELTPSPSDPLHLARISHAGTQVISADATRLRILTVPTSDFGHVGTLPIDDYHDYAATYAIVYAHQDNPSSWLRAGQALSAVWLDATEFNIALLPLSVPVEQTITRQMLGNLIGGDRHAQIAIRLGISDTAQPASPPTPRLPPFETITIDS